MRSFLICFDQKHALAKELSNVDKLHLLKNAFRPVGETAMAFDFKNVELLKDNYCYLNKNHFRTYSWLAHLENRKGLYCKYRTIFSFYVFSELWGWKKSTKT